MAKKKAPKPEEQPIAANAGPTAFQTDPETGETEAVEPPSKSDAKAGKYTPAEGGAARMATMTPKNRPGAVGQLETASGGKK